MYNTALFTIYNKLYENAECCGCHSQDTRAVATIDKIELMSLFFFKSVFFLAAYGEFRLYNYLHVASILKDNSGIN